MIRAAKHAAPNNWRMALRNSFAHVCSNGGFYAPDVEFSVERQGSRRSDCYRIVWSDRLSATIERSGHLVQRDYGTIRVGPCDEAVKVAAEVLRELGKLRSKSGAACVAA